LLTAYSCQRALLCTFSSSASIAAAASFGTPAGMTKPRPVPIWTL
jgi:hypothetical protein